MIIVVVAGVFCSAYIPPAIMVALEGVASGLPSLIMLMLIGIFVGWVSCYSLFCWRYNRELECEAVAFATGLLVWTSLATIVWTYG